ncbi:response regulator [Rufibacter quisquiliarum]|uniref:CheY-like chemotaxis protein n=1 Tax=Rufibacter quisquiliarum TaxID=1549639 RepID=A0A839GQQ9_9BACT|nr:response regulator [Rufibacter quisquiliarum]MBA9079159.1 CheY-like chemotaxis protein [Rufibacter quisquiliarum]
MRKLEAVLVVDDDPACLFIAKSIFKRQHVANQVFTAHNGLEAIKLMRSACTPASGIVCPDLILVDIHMPVMDGFTFLEALQVLKLPSTPVIALLTTSQNVKDVKRAKNFQVDAFLNKPLTFESLENLLQQAE